VVTVIALYKPMHKQLTNRQTDRPRHGGNNGPHYKQLTNIYITNQSVIDATVAFFLFFTTIFEDDKRHRTAGYGPDRTQDGRHGPDRTRPDRTQDGRPRTGQDAGRPATDRTGRDRTGRRTAGYGPDEAICRLWYTKVKQVAALLTARGRIATNVHEFIGPV